MNDMAAKWGLTPRENAVFDILMRRELAHNEVICATIWADKPVNQENMVKQIVCRMRPKLKRHGIRIVTHHGFGYSIPAEDKKKALDE